MSICHYFQLYLIFICILIFHFTLLIVLMLFFSFKNCYCKMFFFLRVGRSIDISPKVPKTYMAHHHKINTHWLPPRVTEMSVPLCSQVLTSHLTNIPLWYLLKYTSKPDNSSTYAMQLTWLHCFLCTCGKNLCSLIFLCHFISSKGKYMLYMIQCSTVSFPRIPHPFLTFKFQVISSKINIKSIR